MNIINSVVNEYNCTATRKGGNAYSTNLYSSIVLRETICAYKTYIRHLCNVCMDRVIKDTCLFKYLMV